MTVCPSCTAYVVADELDLNDGVCAECAWRLDEPTITTGDW